MTLRLLRPDVPDPARWLPYLEASYEVGQFSNFGPNERRLSERLSERLGREMVLVSSATAGLAAVLITLGITGKVALPAFTFPATASAIYTAGAEPVAIDCDPSTWEMCPSALAKRLEEGDIAAVIHVRSFGYCRDISPIAKIVERHDLPLIVDAAAAFGGIDPTGRLVGHHGVAEVFSFHATKPFSIGEGGGIATEPALAKELRSTINFALGGGGGATRWGLNAKMGDVFAAIGQAVLDGFDDVLAHRRAQAAGWMEAIDEALGEKAQLPTGHGIPPWQLFSFRLPGQNCEQIKTFMSRSGIDTRVYYSPTVSSRWDGPEPPEAVRLSRDMLSMPMGRHVTSKAQQQAASCLAQAIACNA